MLKRKLAIINSDPKDCTYGGVAPIMRNMHPYLEKEYDISYFYLSGKWVNLPLPGRLKIMLYILFNWNKIKSNDFILSHVPEGSFLVSYMNKPFSHIYHGNFNPMRGSKYWFGKYFEWLFDLFEKRIEKSCKLKYTVGPVIGDRKKLYNPINHPVKSKDIKDRNGFIFAGRLEGIKNIDRIIRIFATCPKDIKQSNKLYIAGDGTLNKYLHDLVDSLKLNDDVIFTGALSNTDLVELDSNRLILLMASSHEGLPTAIAEAFSVGVPVVSTDVGDISRVVINGETGFVLPSSFKDEEYHSAIKKILSDYSRFSDNAYKKSSIFNAEKITKEMISDFNKLMENEITE